LSRVLHPTHFGDKSFQAMFTRQLTMTEQVENTHKKNKKKRQKTNKQNGHIKPTTKWSHVRKPCKYTKYHKVIPNLQAVMCP